MMLTDLIVVENDLKFKVLFVFLVNYIDGGTASIMYCCLDNILIYVFFVGCGFLNSDLTILFIDAAKLNFFFGGDLTSFNILNSKHSYYCRIRVLINLKY